ncbi:uncharacterized protein [Ptychodera flava]|uniref:uncharacterized protein n=1 Tax=Ptychodera flava TaxID=63121 RepID=UPI00396AA466
MHAKFAVACGLIFGCVVLGYGFQNPLHASCKVDWTFGISCKEVNTRIVNQMKKWKGPENCEGGGEKCLYEVIFSNATYIKGTHTTPVKKYVDTFTFTFVNANLTCKAEGFSSSDVWYAVLDYGTNYCNIHNLIEGAELHKVKGYTKTTSDSICTQYSSANCTVY